MSEMIIDPYRFNDGFAPPDISDLVLWMDGADISTMFQDTPKTVPVVVDGDPVKVWVDKSTSAFDVEAAGGEEPNFKTSVQNGKSAVLGDGTDFMSIQGTSCLTSTLNVSIFFVANLTSDEDVGGIYCNTFNSVERLAVFIDSRTANRANSVIDTQADATLLLTNINDIGTEVVQQTFVRDGAAVEVWFNGVSQDTETVTASSETDNDAIRLFSQHQALNKLDGHIFEVIVYEASLSTADRESVEAYLVNKWGL